MKEVLDKLKPLLAEMQGIFGLESDVHAHTRRLGDICREFIAIDELHIKSLSGAKNIDQVISEIMARCPEDLKGRVSIVLNSIKAFSGADGETLLSLQDLLIRAWSLKNCYSNGADLIFDNLSHNIETGGGCLPGIAARLVQPYTAFIFHVLENNLKNNFVPEHAAELVDNMDLAIVISIWSTQNSNADELEDEEIQLAKALSLGDIQKPLTSSSASAIHPQTPLFNMLQQSEQERLRWPTVQSELEAQKAAQIEEDELLAVKLEFS